MAEGGDFITKGATPLLVGESGAEHVQITPLDRDGLNAPQGQGQVVNISINSPVMTKDYVEDFLIEELNNAIRRGNVLDAN